MERRFDDPFMNILPCLDVHGETRDTVVFPVLDFIRTNIKLKKYKCIIIHGRHGGVLKSTIHDLLKTLKEVDKFYAYGSNDGVTVIELMDTLEKRSSKMKRNMVE